MATIAPIETTSGFSDLGLNKQLLESLIKSGYTTPTPIQQQMIPHVLAGHDVIGQAQTGTGKTAAFALPLLNMLAIGKKVKPQIIVLTPTRELAIQVSDSFQNYGRFMQNLKVLPIYGGQEYSTQLRQLERGVHVIVGTPGRIMDHIRRGSLSLNSITSFVLDEADEMLKMGFIDDVEWILQQAPADKQVALFSATMPASIRRIANNHLRSPQEITVEGKTATAAKINQRYIITNGRKAKHEAIERILEAENFEGILIFVRTKIETVELAEHLSSIGYSCGPLNGDIPQNQRLRMVDQLKSGKLDIVVATDVAARGLDVDRISHVINYDVPSDSEAYIHRIGRTGRAGRHGSAILFLHPREKRMLRIIEKDTKSSITQMRLPTPAEINTRRVETFNKSITAALAEDCSFFDKLIEKYCLENDIPSHRVAAAIAKMLHNKAPLFVEQQNKKIITSSTKKEARRTQTTSEKTNRQYSKSTAQRPPEQGMDRYRIDVGEIHGVKPANIVGAIANEADIDSQHIGRISIFPDYSTVDLPYGMPKQILRLLQKARINSRMMQLKKEAVTLPEEERENLNKPKKKIKKKTAPKQPHQRKSIEKKRRPTKTIMT
jgi:ATP-dependent RNA helicase DeaD